MAKRKYRPFSLGLIPILGNIQDPWCRALACCQAGVIGETGAERELLRSCLGVDPYLDALIGQRLEIRALPLSRPLKPQRRKVWTPPNRLPSLFTQETSEIRQRHDLAAAAVDAPLGPIDLEHFDWAGAAAAATLSVDLLDLVVGPSGAVSEFADLIMDMSEEAKANLLEEWQPIPRPPSPEPRGNLFREFGIDLPAADVRGTCPLELKRRRSRVRRCAVTLPSLFVILRGENE